MYFLLIFNNNNFTFLLANNPCEHGWEPFKDQKCIKLVSTSLTQSFADAVKTCEANQGSRLVSIHYADEQAFLNDYLYSKMNTVVDNVWLGGQESTTDDNHLQIHFKWSDSSRLTFTNWALGNPKKDSQSTCIQMHSEKELRGKWSNEPCTRKNLVVCERTQSWSMSKMQEMMQKMMLNPPLPFGFIYVQLPKEAAPAEVWPWMTWTDVSATYDSTFFRVTGSKGAAPFGTVQEDFSPFIDEIAYGDCEAFPFDQCKVNFPLVSKASLSRTGGSGWTGNILTANGFNNGKTPNTAWRGSLKFHMATGEVRPRNMAVKIWKRTG